jgi:Dopey, N-terminal
VFADLLKDPAFKRFGAAVDRAVAAFDTIVEWTEYIVFLGRLQKVLPERLQRTHWYRHSRNIAHFGLSRPNWLYQVGSHVVSTRLFRQGFINGLLKSILSFSLK